MSHIRIALAAGLGLLSACATTSARDNSAATGLQDRPPDATATVNDREIAAPASAPAAQPVAESAAEAAAMDEVAAEEQLGPDTAPSTVGASELDIPLGEHELVENWVAYFSGPGAARFGRWLERYGRYAPLMRPMLKEAGLPEDTIYLAMIESGFVPCAYSHAHAVGPWQFIAATGAAYGLKQNFWVDERRDPVKSTRAAARHLRDLYAEFGDWHLAWAAYNAGPGKVRTAIARYGTRDFFELVRHPYLRPETKHYVPKLIAAATVASDPKRYGLAEFVPQPAFAYDAIEVTDATDLGLVAEVCAVELDTLSELNPELRRFATPPVARGDAPYVLRVPTGFQDGCQAALDAVPPAKRLTFRHHRVRSGEVPGKIARRYGISLKVLLDMNRIRDPRRLRAGADLIIPIPSRVPERALRAERSAGQPGSSKARKAASASARREQKAQRDKAPARRKASQPAGAEAITHVVVSGDSLWSISRRYGVTVAKLKRWNGFRRTPVLRPGQQLVVYQVANE